MTIDVGASPIDRSAMVDGGITRIVKENPANFTGLIFVIQIYCAVIMDSIKVASFTAVGNDLTTREYVSLANTAVGLNTFVAPTDFTPFEIRAGDYIGIYFNNGSIDYIGDSGGAPGIWREIGDFIPCTSETFGLTNLHNMSLYATGHQLGRLNIGDAWKDVQNYLLNVGDSWKSLADGKENIADVWKDILH